MIVEVDGCEIRGRLDEDIENTSLSESSVASLIRDEDAGGIFGVGETISGEAFEGKVSDLPCRLYLFPGLSRTSLSCV